MNNLDKYVNILEKKLGSNFKIILTGNEGDYIFNEFIKFKKSYEKFGEEYPKSIIKNNIEYNLIPIQTEQYVVLTKKQLNNLL